MWVVYKISLVCSHVSKYQRSNSSSFSILPHYDYWSLDLVYHLLPDQMVECSHWTSFVRIRFVMKHPPEVLIQGGWGVGVKHNVVGHTLTEEWSHHRHQHVEQPDDHKFYTSIKLWIPRSIDDMTLSAPDWKWYVEEPSQVFAILHSNSSQLLIMLN